MSTDKTLTLRQLLASAFERMHEEALELDEEAEDGSLET